MSNIKNKKYEVPLEIQLDLYTILNIFDDEAHNCPEEFAKFMIELGHDGDWTLEHDYLKLLKKDIKADFGKEAANHIQAVLDIMEKPSEEDN